MIASPRDAPVPMVPESALWAEILARGSPLARFRLTAAPAASTAARDTAAARNARCDDPERDDGDRQSERPIPDAVAAYAARCDVREARARRADCYADVARAFAPHEDDGVRGAAKSLMVLAGAPVAQLCLRLPRVDGVHVDPVTLRFARDSIGGRLWIRVGPLHRALSGATNNGYGRLVTPLVRIAPWTAQKIWLHDVGVGNSTTNACWHVRFTHAAVSFVLTHCKAPDRARVEAVRSALLPVGGDGPAADRELPLPVGCEPTHAHRLRAVTTVVVAPRQQLPAPSVPTMAAIEGCVPDVPVDRSAEFAIADFGVCSVDTQRRHIRSA
jgi:hypothetical protein